MEEQTKELINSILIKKPNYYGVYKHEIYTIQLKLCFYNNKIIIPERVNIVAYCFWDKYFNLEKQISWTDFEQSFKDEFNIYVQNTNEFKKILCDNDDNIQLEKYLDLTNKYNGIYELYQKITEKNPIIYYVNETNKLYVDETLLGKYIVSISSVGNHVAALTNEGHLYMKGENLYGQLGIPTLYAREYKLNKYFIEHNIHIKKVVCGYANTGIITLDNNLYMWGYGGQGRLGNGSIIDLHIPTKITTFNNNVKDLQLGSCHTCVLTNDGKVYTFGRSYYTGINTSNDILVPTLIPFSEKIESISIGGGGYHTMALSITNKLYMWGHNRVGQLGCLKNNLPIDNDMAAYSPIPIHIKELDSLNIVKINAFWANSVITCANGNIYVCGKNFNGQIPINDNSIFKINERGDSYLDRFTKISSDIKNIYFNDKSVIIIKSGISTNKILDVVFSKKYKIFLISKYTINTLEKLCLDKLKHFDFYDTIKSYLAPSDKITIQSSEEIDFN